MRKALYLLAFMFLLSACSSDDAGMTVREKSKIETGKEQGLNYQVKEPEFDAAKKAEPPRKPASSLDQ